ncbi:Ig-like domain-containing protein [Nonomuraea zeae]|uniref:Ig-like domain-containing protein n=1 Tax=Nonomuraea zeae TaxID=1642303 RepID=UPI0014794322|nr:Ig-like domain-containing protein [Nonomuraea zeae]
MKYRNRSGRAEVFDGGDKKVAELTPALILDAAATASLAAGKISAVETELDGTELIHKPDMTLLADPATTYPVTLVSNPTPWYGAGFPTDTFVSNDSRFTMGSGQQYMDSLLAGRNNFDGASSYYIYRSYLKYDLSNAPWYGRPIINADVRPWNYITTHCGGDENTPKMVVRRVTSDWSLSSSSSVSLRWDRQPSVTTTGEEVKGGGVGRIRKANGSYVYCSQLSQELYYSIEDIVQAWADGEPNYGLQIASYGDTGGTSNFREFLSTEWAGVDGRGPVLFVEYDTPQEPEAIVYSYEGPELTEPPSYTEALAMQIETVPEDLDPSPVTVEDLRARMESAANRDAATIVGADELPPAEPQPDTTPPSVIETVPAANSADAPTATIVQATFSETVSGAQLTLKDAAGNPVPGTASTEQSGQLISFTPAQALAANTAYSAEVSGATDSSGNSMSAPYTWTFTTVSAAPCTALAWDAQTDYWWGDQVSHNGHLWVVGQEWADPGDEPGVHPAWQDLGPCDGSTPVRAIRTRPAEPRQAPSAAAATEPEEFSYKRVWFNDCIAESHIWHHVNTFNWCYTHYYGITLYDKTSKVPLGWLQFRATTLIHTRIGSQNSFRAFRDDEASLNTEIDVRMQISSLKRAGLTSGVELVVSLHRAGSPTPRQCDLYGPNEHHRSGSIEDWIAYDRADFTAVSAMDSSLGSVQVGTCTLSPKLTVRSRYGSESFWLYRDDPPVVRCDEVPYMSQHLGGCIVPSPSPRTMAYDTTSASHAGVALHIQKAFNDAGNTTPQQSGKEVPGNLAANIYSFRHKPLHRVDTESAIAEQTEDIVEATCAPLPPVAGADCDEYPFHSSYEGAGRVYKTGALTNNFSVQRVNLNQNRSAGTSLNWFYWRYRVLYDDPFWNIIMTNGVMPKFE